MYCHLQAHTDMPSESHVHKCTHARMHTQTRMHTHTNTYSQTHTCTHTHKVGETFEDYTIAHLFSKLKMVIDPRNINGQQCFSLSCEGEQGEAF